MTDSLEQLLAKAASLGTRGAAMRSALTQAEAAYIEALRVGTEARVVEAFRVQCATIYEAKLDLIGEAATVQRQLLEAGHGPQL